MQDGVTCLTTKDNLNFIFLNSRVISNKTDVIWTPKSPYLNPLWFYLLVSCYVSCLQMSAQDTWQADYVSDWLLWGDGQEAGLEAVQELLPEGSIFDELGRGNCVTN